MEETYTIDKAIRELESVPRYMLSSDLAKALEFAIDFMKENSSKPSLDDKVYMIDYYRGYKDDWKWYYHVPTGECIEQMRIGDLVELIKTGRLDKDCFTKTNGLKGRKLDCGYVDNIKYMMLKNGYITEAEYAK